MAIKGKYTPPGQPLPSIEEAAAVVARQQQREAETASAPLSLDNFVGRIGKFLEDDQNQETLLSVAGGVVGAYVGGPVGAAAGSKLGTVAAGFIPGTSKRAELLPDEEAPAESSPAEFSLTGDASEWQAFNLSDGRYLLVRPSSAFVGSPRARSVSLRAGRNVLSLQPLTLAASSGGQANIAEVHSATED